jgi:cobalt-zinc-cadmium efflux system membrane fusion protein
MHTKKPLMTIMLVFALLVYSCNHTDDHVRVIADSTGNITAVHLSSEEIEHAGIKYGNILKQVVEKQVPCSGYLIVAPKNKISIPSPASGKITSIYYPVGHYLKAGSEIASLENIDFITLQQDYLEAKNQFDYLREEYARQGELTVENATSVKKMQIARRDFQSAELRLKALQLQLEIIGICTDSLRFDNMSPVIPIKVSGSGNISTINIHPGLFVEKGATLFEIVNTQPLLAELQVPESIIQFLHPGQLVDFYLANDSLSINRAQLLSIIREVNPKNHTAKVYAELLETNKQYIPGMSINATININKDTTSVLNSHAIFHCPAVDYLFVKQKGTYLRIPVKPGKSIGEMIEINGFPSGLTDSVVYEGVEYLNSIFERQ